MTSSRTILRDGAGRSRLRFLFFLLAALGFALVAASAASKGERQAAVIHVDGVIGPASADYFRRSLVKARESGVSVVVLQLDTPGGLDTSMREMIREIIASPTPVITYVAPGGARAASAGTFILYASHVAAMAPGTNVGAATPVEIGGAAPLPQPRPGTPEAGQDPAERARAAAGKADAKAVNDAVGYIRALARLRGRDAAFGEKAVREAASLDADDALKAGVIDFMARDVTDVLVKADGRTVMVGGAPLVLKTHGLAVREIRPDWRHQLLAVITNPNVALILMMIGVYGLILEFMHPGAIYPGAIGAISLVVALYGLAVLPVNYAGLVLILVGLALITAEAFAPSFGALGISGTAAFVIGGMLLIDTEAPGFGVSLPLLVALALTSLLFTGLVVRMALGARRRRVVTGREEMIGARGVVQDWQDGRGHVFAHSERWRAVSDAALKPGDRVKTLGIDNLTLTVAPEEGDRT